MQAVSFSELRGHLKEIMDTSADQHEAVCLITTKPKVPNGKKLH